MKLFGVVGSSGSGKTVLVEQLVPRLAARGLRVSVIKHSHHAFDLDRPGKDSWRHREAGAHEVMVVGPQRWAVFHELRGAPEATLDELLQRLAPCDLVLVEGFHGATDIPRLEVFRPAHGQPPRSSSAAGVVAVATDAPGALEQWPEKACPVLDLNDPDAIAAWIVAALKEVPPRSVGERTTAGAAYGISGWSGAGKTTLIGHVIPECRRRGLRVSVIKHAHKGFDIDQPGKDSFRLRVAGAGEVLLAGPARWALVHELRTEPDPPLAACLTRLASCDLVLVEGFKQDALPKLEVFRAAHGRPPMYLDNPMIQGVATDSVVDTPLPRLDLNDPVAVADFVLAQAEVVDKAPRGDADAVSSMVGVILAGGLGRRMGGVDKGLQIFNHRPLVAWVLERLRPQVGEVFINANQNHDAYRALGCRLISDEVPDFAGPLAGLHAALAASMAPLVLTVPCDSPFLPPDLATRLLAALQLEDADVAVAHAGGQLQPVFCLCRRDVLPSLTDYLAAGERKFERWLQQQQTAVVVFDDATAFSNINTPEDLARYADPKG